MIAVSFEYRQLWVVRRDGRFKNNKEVFLESLRIVIHHSQYTFPVQCSRKRTTLLIFGYVKRTVSGYLQKYEPGFYGFRIVSSNVVSISEDMEILAQSKP